MPTHRTLFRMSLIHPPPFHQYPHTRYQEHWKHYQKQEPGRDQIPNELLKIASNSLAPYLKEFFNGCLQNGYFPLRWKRALTAIIRKSGKDEYSDPKEYLPIALLNTLGKLFEKIINDRLSFLA
ncbi:hypothetical protein O181_084188 [Austropuccinia psidii MF-1]|uniref:Reverse transcriptase domain-containing protein n=1 Tax=Austropuccinia psidii MF-1 TaxID=1389203 RepID=A0A9Q3FQT8_9BASI|nr:hypothetical protein [Austropuccinia psidii MF-1]